jgi:hypothetical protein
MPFIVLGVLALVGGGVWLGIHLERRRREAFGRVAARLGYAFSHERSPVDLPFALFRLGRRRYGTYFLDRVDPDAVAGLGDVRITLFEYHYETTSGIGEDETTHSHWFSCASVEPGIDLGRVRIRHEHFGDRLAALAGFEDIDFEDPEFSKRFHVSAKDRRDAYALLEHDMMRALLGKAHWTFETGGPLLLIHRGGKLSPERVKLLDRIVHDVLAALPRTLVNNERTRRGLAPALDAGAAARRG